MWRRVSTLIFTISVIALLLAMTIYIRSKFRADVITIITSGHHCVVISSVEGMFRIDDRTPWPGTHQFQWTSGEAHFHLFAHHAQDTLLGPEQIWEDWDTWPKPGSRIPGDFDWSHGNSLNAVPRIDRPWRDWDFGPDSGPAKPLVVLNYRTAAAPVWSIPTIFALMPGFWLVAITIRRLRRCSRQRRELCVYCGYDLRQSPSHCPECGAVPSISRVRVSPSTPVSPG